MSATIDLTTEQVRDLLEQADDDIVCMVLERMGYVPEDEPYAPMETEDYCDPSELITAIERIVWSPSDYDRLCNAVVAAVVLGQRRVA